MEKIGGRKQFFNIWEFNEGLKLLNTDPYECERRLKIYFEKYPKDYSGKTDYIMLLIRLGKLDEAEMIYNATEKEVNDNAHFLSTYKKYDVFRRNMLLCKIKLLSYREKYQELFHLYVNSQEILDDADLARYISSYCRKQLDLLAPSEKIDRGYLYSQIVEYSEARFLEHIKNHMASFNKDSDIFHSALFYEGFDIVEVVKEVKKYIPSDDRLLPGYFEDLYFFKYDNCGRHNGKPVNFFEVHCFHNTQNMITMYPIDYGNKPVDLNYMVTKEEKPVVKVNQIDRFNARYNRKQV